MTKILEESRARDRQFNSTPRGGWVGVNLARGGRVGVKGTFLEELGAIFTFIYLNFGATYLNFGATYLNFGKNLSKS